MARNRPRNRPLAVRAAATDAPNEPVGVARSGGTLSFFPGTSSGSADDGRHSVDQMLESVLDLMYPSSIDTYSKMRNDPTITSMIAAYVSPVVKGDWRVDPRGASERIVRIVSDSLGVPVLGANDPGPVRRRGVHWVDHITLAATLQLVYGHAPFEPWYEVRADGAAYLAGLGERLPTSISQILTTRAGALAGIRQKATSWDEDPIPADRLLWYVQGREGAAWQGRSMLRHAFGPWLIKQDMMRVAGTGYRRYSTPVPVLSPLPGFTPTETQWAAARAAAAAWRVGESAGMVPHGFKVELVGAQGTLHTPEDYLAWLDQQIARGALTSFLDLGNTGQGNRALGSVFADLLTDAVDGFARRLAETATGLSVALTDFNEGPDASAPAVVCTVAQTQVVALVGDLVQQGALTADAALQAWIRDTMGLPDQDVPEGPSQDEGRDGDDGTSRPVTARRHTHPRRVAAADRTYRRKLTDAEEAGGLDPEAIDDAHSQVMTELLDQWPEVNQAWIDEIITQVEDAAGVESLAALTLEPGDATALVEAALQDAWSAGATTAVNEAATSGAGVSRPNDEPSWEAVAAAVAAVLASGMVNAAQREAVRVVSADGTGLADAAVRVRTHLEALSGVYPQDVLGGAVADGINAGRRDVFASAGTGWTLMASEVRDGSTCAACLDVDGFVYDDVEAATHDYPTGGYALCLGRERCRGVLVLVPKEAAL